MIGVLREIDQERMVSIIDLESKTMLHTGWAFSLIPKDTDMWDIVEKSILQEMALGTIKTGMR